MSKHIELAKKLKALADKGIGGEKVNAEKMLNDLLKKHNLCIEDIEGEAVSEYFFKIKEEDSQLLCQITKSVNDDISFYGPFKPKDIKYFRFTGNYMIKCTTAEYVEIESKFNIYARLYKQELDIFYAAFCTANDLLVKQKGKAITTSDLSPKELEDWRRTQEMARKIKTESIRKQLSDKTRTPH